MPEKKNDNHSLKKTLQEYKQTKPEQLTLFEMIAPDEKKYSNTIELYDFIPKYYWGKTDNLRVEGKFLDVLEREFMCRGKHYKVKIKPASIEQKNGMEKYFYPSKREELVEDALRKLVCEGKGRFLDDSAGVFFSLYELQEELKSNGHTYSITQIKDALMVCAQSSLVVTNEEGTELMVSTIFPTLSLQTKDDWKGNGEKTESFVRFNPLVTKSIMEMQFRQFNYQKSMQYKSVIARQLHKRMSHHYIQASIANSYNINLTTIIRDFGLTAYDKISNNLREVEKALSELADNHVILKYDALKTFNSKNKNKITDVNFIIVPHPIFVNEVMTSNLKAKKIEGKATRKLEE
jgi:hypothetical protein